MCQNLLSPEEPCLLIHFPTYAPPSWRKGASGLTAGTGKGTRSWDDFVCLRKVLIHQLGLSLVLRVYSCPFMPGWCWGLIQDRLPEIHSRETVTGCAVWYRCGGFHPPVVPGGTVELPVEGTG